MKELQKNEFAHKGFSDSVKRKAKIQEKRRQGKKAERQRSTQERLKHAPHRPKTRR
jgi:hypothetical protein